MIGAFFDLLTPIYEHEATRQRIAVLEADMERHRREYEEQLRAHAAADPAIIDVEAREVDDVPALPAPEGTEAP
ncbi:hypothetical protein ACL58G_07830 [Massilia sp. GER05]|jgi:hypothetical protein|uniref:hypothetical protein n=1 Tax=Massilia sp. GER05 TaxID=3394605 RepID=UPI003F876639